MSSIEVGQVLSLKIRYNNSGDVSSVVHPYLVVDVNNELNVVEIAQLDSLKGKEWKAFKWGNKPIYATNPTETVIDKDSYIQMDNKFLLENHSGLEYYRRQKDKLSEKKLNNVLKAYRKYHETHQIDEDKQVYITRIELEELQSI